MSAIDVLGRLRGRDEFNQIHVGFLTPSVPHFESVLVA